jgi:hypothetical protein
MALFFPLIIARIVLVAILVAAAVPASAQTPSIDSGAAPAITLSPEQRQTVYQSVSATQKNTAAPDGFRTAVGARIPDAIALNPIPQTLVSLMPAVKGLEVTMIEKQVVLVDPNSKLIVAVITPSQ